MGSLYTPSYPPCPTPWMAYYASGQDLDYSRLKDKVTQVSKQEKPYPGNHYWSGRICAIYLLVLTSSDQLLLIMKMSISLFYKTSYFIEEVNCIEPTPSGRVPCPISLPACIYACLSAYFPECLLPAYMDDNLHALFTPFLPSCFSAFLPPSLSAWLPT